MSTGCETSTGCYAPIVCNMSPSPTQLHNWWLTRCLLHPQRLLYTHWPATRPLPDIHSLATIYLLAAAYPLDAAYPWAAAYPKAATCWRAAAHQLAATLPLAAKHPLTHWLLHFRWLLYTMCPLAATDHWLLQWLSATYRLACHMSPGC